MRFVLTFCFMILPVFAQAKTPLKDVEVIREGMLTIGMADIIRRKCDGISARMIQAYFAIKGLEREAQNLGYSAAEIEAYTDDDAEKQRLIAIALDRLADKGAIQSDPETFCTVGRAEIAARTPIGKLLIAK